MPWQRLLGEVWVVSPTGSAARQAFDRIAALQVAEALHEAGLSPTLAVGGGSARWEGAEQAGMVVLPNRINDAASMAAALARGAKPNS